MKNTKNKTEISVCLNKQNWVLNRFLKKTTATHNVLVLDTSQNSFLFHEKLQIIFANIRV
jgi:hypothetical protein